MVVGICMAKDEADIIGRTVARMLAQVDAVIVADNGSTDGTREILEALDVELIDDRDPAYFQSRKMTALAQHAEAMGAEWVVPFDSDEVWYSPFGRIADVLRGFPDTAIASAAIFDHVPTAEDGVEADPTERIRWHRREPCPLHKVACRPSLPVMIEQGNHGASYPYGRVDGQLVIRHFPYRSADQFIRKARNGSAAYAATDLPEDFGAHWRGYGRILAERGPDALADVFREFFWAADPGRDSTLILDPCP